MVDAFANGLRVLDFDKRGTGLSDRVSRIPDLEARMDDIRAVMDAAESEQAVLLGWGDARGALGTLRRHVSRPNGGSDPQRWKRADGMGGRLPGA